MNSKKLHQLLDKQDQLRTERELVIKKGDYESARELQDEIEKLNDKILSMLGKGGI